jgi:hypothetical protein
MGAAKRIQRHEVVDMIRIPLFLAISLAASALAQAPYYPQRGAPPYPNAPNSGYGNAPYNYGNPNGVVGRVLSDLRTAELNARLNRSEGNHFNTASAKLQQFEQKLSQGRFDKGKLDKAIDNIKHLTRTERVSPRDRGQLAADVQDLRQLRATRGYGYQGNGYYPNRY